MRALVLAALLVPAVAHAEVVGKGLRAGVVTFSMKDTQSSDNAVNTNPGFVAGGYLIVELTPGVSIQPEIAVSEKRAFVEHCSPCMTLDKLSLWYVELPVLLRFDTIPNPSYKLHFDVGPEIVIAAGATDIVQPTGTERTIANVVPANIGGVVGAGVELGAGPGRVTLDVRYQRWVADVVDNGGGDTVKSSNQVLATLGYVFP